jgi:CubicO group peptidase (beta-lactamase class C family)
VSAVILGLPAGVGAQQSAPADYIARIEAPQPDAGDNELAAMSVEQLLDHFNVPGFSVAVIHDFAVHWAKGYGIRDVETGEPVDHETMFQAASISKPVAAMGSLKAVQDGLFGLDDDINDVLTSWTLDGEGFTTDQPVTPRTLMSHTSGLGDAFGFPGYDPSVTPPTPIQIFDGHELSNVGPLFMERAPYEAFEYSGGGVTVMQQALADARGRAFEDVLQDDVLGPLGMTRSSFVQPLSAEHDRNAARAHDREGAAMGAKWHVYPEMAAAGLWTTPTDLARFAIEVQKSARGESNRVLDRATVREMLTPVGVGDFAVGFQLAKEGEGWYFQHGGSNWGFRGNVMAHTVKGYGFAIMTNADQGGALANEIGRRIQVAYEWDSMAAPVPRGYRPPVQRNEVEVPAEVLAEYVGTYPLNDELTLEFRIEEGRFMVEATGQGTFPVFAESDVDFFLKVAEVTFTFTRDDDGVVDGLIFHQGGQTLTATKVR